MGRARLSGQFVPSVLSDTPVGRMFGDVSVGRTESKAGRSRIDPAPLAEALLPLGIPTGLLGLATPPWKQPCLGFALHPCCPCGWGALSPDRGLGNPPRVEAKELEGCSAGVWGVPGRCHRAGTARAEIGRGG